MCVLCTRPLAASTYPAPPPSGAELITFTTPPFNCQGGGVGRLEHAKGHTREPGLRRAGLQVSPGKVPLLLCEAGEEAQSACAGLGELALQLGGKREKTLLNGGLTVCHRLFLVNPKELAQT